MRAAAVASSVSLVCFEIQKRQYQTNGWDNISADTDNDNVPTLIGRTPFVPTNDSLPLHVKSQAGTGGAGNTSVCAHACAGVCVPVCAAVAINASTRQL